MKSIIFCAIVLLVSVKSDCPAGKFLNIDNTCGDTCADHTTQVQVPLNILGRLLTIPIINMDPVATGGPVTAGPFYTACYCVAGYQAQGDVCKNTTNIATANNFSPINITINNSNSQQQVASAESNSISSARSNSNSKPRSQSKSSRRVKRHHKRYHH